MNQDDRNRAAFQAALEFLTYRLRELARPETSDEEVSRHALTLASASCDISEAQLKSWGYR